MTDVVVDGPLDGFPPSSRTRIVTYDFDDGIQGPNHPHPGRRYRGTIRECYLPSPEGDRVHDLLKLAFERRLIFSVGDSQTNPHNKDCVVWAGIHHKTSPYGGATGHGYPDETYLARVTAELKDAGVT